MHGLDVGGLAGSGDRTPGRVTALDLRAEAGAEPLFRLQLDAVLLGKGARQRGPGDVAAVDQDLAEPLAAFLLLRQRLLELRGGQQPLLDEKCAKRAPSDVRRSHGSPFGLRAGRLEAVSPRGYSGGSGRRLQARQADFL